MLIKYSTTRDYHVQQLKTKVKGNMFTFEERDWEISAFLTKIIINCFIVVNNRKQPIFLSSHPIFFLSSSSIFLFLTILSHAQVPVIT